MPSIANRTTETPVTARFNNLQEPDLLDVPKPPRTLTALIVAHGPPWTFDFHFATMRANPKTWHAWHTW